MSTSNGAQQSSVDAFDNFIRDSDKKVKTLVRKITHSGDTDLNNEDLKELKTICKSFEEQQMVTVYKECFKCLGKSHSQVRVATLKLIDYLFQKSHIIRRRLLDDFNTFIELTLAITQKPKEKLTLPPPKKFANLLKELTAKCIYKWHADFGRGYEKLRYAYKHLSEHRLVDFSQFRVHTHEQLIRQQKLKEQQEKILTRSIENRLKEFRELKPEIEQLLAQIESLIDLLLPMGTGDNESELIDDGPGPSAREHGIANLSETLEIEFSPFLEVERGEDNKDVVQTLRELKRELIENKLVKLVAIEKTIAKRSETLVQKLREIIDIKTRSTNIVLKLAELKIVDSCENGKKASTLDAPTSDDDSDFQEVQEKDLETYIPKSMRYEYGLEPIDPKELESSKRTTSTDQGFISMPSTSYGETHVMSQPCNVMLDSGKLCPRRDRYKCPFHGKIIPRDLIGVPLNEHDRVEEEKRRRRVAKVPEWQDPELLADIRAATGIDLTMPSRGKSKVSSKKSLANPKTCDLTPKQRLQKRLKLFVK